MNISENSINEQNSGEISIVEIVNFFVDSWKKITVAGLVGGILGLGGWWLFSDYLAVYTLVNNTNTNTNGNTYALDLVSWKIIQKGLPNLASQIEGEGKAPEGYESLYRRLSSEQWWQKNAIPNYAISKADAKDFSGSSKHLDSASMTILSLSLTSSGSSRDKAMKNVVTTANFLRTGGAYLQLRNLLSGYEGESISLAADIQKSITTTEVEINYQKKRLQDLMLLHKGYQGQAVAQQIADVNEANAKYLPLATQIIAVNADINRSREDLQRLRNRLAQIELMKTFLAAASPLAENTYDGLKLNSELLKIEGQLRTNLIKDDMNSQEILDQLHAQLLQLQARFTKGLDANTAPTSSGKGGMTKAIVGGLLASCFLMFFVILGNRVWVSFKSGRLG